MAYSKKNLIRNILVAVIASIVIAYFYPHPEANRYAYQEGKPWNYAKLIAPFDIPIHPDSATVEAARDTLEARFVPIYEIDTSVLDSILERLPDNNKALRNKLGNELREAYAAGVVDMPTKERIAAGTLPKVRILKNNTISEMPAGRFLSPRDVYMHLDSIFADTASHRYFAGANLQNLLVPNYIYDEEENRRRYEYDYLTLTADRGVIIQGQTIIDKGAIITSQDFTNLRTYEQMLAEQHTSGHKSKLLVLAGEFVYIVLILLALMVYFHFFTPAVYSSMRAITFIYSMIVLFFLGAVGLGHFVAQGIYITPLMIVTILVLVFFDGRTALMVTSALTLVCAGITTFPLEFIFMQFCASCAGVFSLRQLSTRMQLLRSAALIMFFYILSYVSLEVLMNGSFDGFSWRMVTYLAINGVLTCLAYVLLLVFERIFGFMSIVTLVELADINNPLLMRLSNECPGTFQHSIAVSNLASDAAARVGANVQLIRAGALYHDIGKISNPAFFTENQHGVNPHDALPPERSASIIISHIQDGLKLADRYGLPRVIRSFIKEHHGAGVAKYFYYNFCKKHEGEQIDKTPFTYPGPNPQSRETSILMMADSVEAASRSLKSHTREDIAELVNKIIDGQIADGLHNESTLEFRDVSTIKDAFIKRLMTIYHSRIAYPKAPTSAQ